MSESNNLMPVKVHTTTCGNRYIDGDALFGSPVSTVNLIRRTTMPSDIDTAPLEPTPEDQPVTVADNDVAAIYLDGGTMREIEGILEPLAADAATNLDTHIAISLTGQQITTLYGATYAARRTKIENE